MIVDGANLKRSHRLGGSEIVAVILWLAVEARNGIHVVRAARVAAQGRGASPGWGFPSGLSTTRPRQDSQTRKADYATLGSPLNRRSSTGDSREGDRGSAGARSYAAAWAALRGVAG